MFEVVGNASKVAPEHIAATCVNVGVTFGFTVITFALVPGYVAAVTEPFVFVAGGFPVP